MDYRTWSMVNRLWSIIHTKTPDGEAEGFTAVGVRMVFYQIVWDLGSERLLSSKRTRSKYTQFVRFK
jgi:hypothetical protein